MDTLVAVHATPWRESHAFLTEEVGEPDLDGHLSRTAEWYRWAVDGRRFPTTDAALEYLMDRRADVTAGEPVLVWGDARIGNMIFDADLRVAAALDWEVACIGPPAIDVAHWLVFDEFATTACGVDRLDGFPGRDETIARYEAASGHLLHDLEYFEILSGVLPGHDADPAGRRKDPGWVAARGEPHGARQRPDPDARSTARSARPGTRGGLPGAPAGPRGAASHFSSGYGCSLIAMASKPADSAARATSPRSAFSIQRS